MKQKEPKGFRLVITDLDSNEVVEDSVIDCFIGGISRKDAKDTSTSVQLTKCTPLTMIGTVNEAKKAAKRSIDDLLNAAPEEVRFMLEALIEVAGIDSEE